MSQAASQDLAACSNVSQLIKWSTTHPEAYKAVKEVNKHLPPKNDWRADAFAALKQQLQQGLSKDRPGSRPPAPPAAPGVRALNAAVKALAACTNTHQLTVWATDHAEVYQHAREALPGPVKLPPKTSWSAEDFQAVKSTFFKYFASLGIRAPPTSTAATPTPNHNRQSIPQQPAPSSSHPTTKTAGIRALTAAAKAIAACSNASQLDACCAEHTQVYQQAKQDLSLAARSSWKAADFSTVQSALLRYLSAQGVKLPPPQQAHMGNNKQQAGKQDGSSGKPAKPPAQQVNPQRKATDLCDEEGRLWAELCNGEDIAQGFGGVKNTVDIARHGKMTATRADLLSQVPDREGNYMWLVHPPRGQRWVPVYLGKAGGNSDGTLRSRFDGYINTNGTFGPKAEHAKYAVMLDVLSRGFSIQARFRTCLKAAHKSEDSTLERFNFPLNNHKNGGYRAVRLPGGSAIRDYPVLDDELQATAQSLYTLIAFNKAARAVPVRTT